MYVSHLKLPQIINYYLFFCLLKKLMLQPNSLPEGEPDSVVSDTKVEPKLFKLSDSGEVSFTTCIHMLISIPNFKLIKIMLLCF
jgi:hypothetical protein